mgnify:CR=1 FL=1
MPQQALPLAEQPGQRVNRIMSRFKKGETAVATVSGISFARLLGVTSPKIRTTMVSTKVDTVAPRSGPAGG